MHKEVVRPHDLIIRETPDQRARLAQRFWTSLLTTMVVGRSLSGIGVFYAIVSDMRTLSLFTLILACLTDALDGQLAKRWGAKPAFGPYSDSVADCLFILGSFAAFVAIGLYPLWVLLLIVVMFLQFVLTSGLRRPIYDPLGKYYGAALFGAVGITLLWPNPFVHQAVLIGVLTYTAASICGRSLLLWRRRRITGQHQ